MPHRATNLKIFIEGFLPEAQPSTMRCASVRTLLGESSEQFSEQVLPCSSATLSVIPVEQGWQPDSRQMVGG